MVNIQEIIKTDKEVLSGQPVFAGTRVSVESLFDHLEAGVSLDEFLDDFPTVTREQAVALLDIANKIMTSGNVSKLYEAIA
ncbi:MAG: DUF433 domain-containing protein [Sphingobacteriales bacterium]